MSTYGELQSSIIQDLGNRTDLAAVVTAELPQRITYFQDQPFSQQEATDSSLTTATSTAAYTLATTVAQVTGAWYLYAGNIWLPLNPTSIEVLNSLDNIVPPVQSPPTDYAIYGRQIRLYPWPSGAWQMKLNVIARTAVPSTSGDANLWTQDAFALIRHATVEVVAAQYVKKPDLAMQAGTLKLRELAFLLDRATILSATGRVTPHWY